MKKSPKRNINDTPNALYEMAVNDLQNNIQAIDDLLKKQRVAEVRSLFSHISLMLAIGEAVEDKNCSPEEIVNMVNKCAEENNIKLRKIRVNCFHKRNAKSALKEYIKLDSDEHNDELKSLLKIIEEYIVDNGHIDFDKKKQA